MQLEYKLKIENPTNHLARVIITGKRPANERYLTFFLPSWSPGSYLMREYARNVRWFKFFDASGKQLYFEQIHKGQWKLDFDHPEFGKCDSEFSVEYEIYCHELTVRTSHIDESHAFIHGPSVFMGVLEHNLLNPTLELEFPPLWSKVSTGLKDISEKREVFKYEAPDYDLFIDAPIEIGCHETDGFMVNDKPHELAFYGPLIKHKENIKADIKTIVEHVSELMGGMPYEEKYTFITHFLPGKFGGLEHCNSTALHFDSLKMNERKGYVRWLELVAHEYFHTWNVKRIRPKELGPFDYVNEGLTRMHWLTEGLTSFMDQLLVLRAGLVTLPEYAEMMKDNFNAYFSIPGKKFHSLEDSSFNAWIKLYRPDENSKNSSISYYLKGGLVFFALNILLYEKKSGINDLLSKLWDRYLENPKEGMEASEVYSMIEEVGDSEIRKKFENMIQTTEEVDYEELCSKMGFEFVWTENESSSWLGTNCSFKGDRIVIDNVVLDSPAYKSGLNAGDEILAIDGMRVLKDRYKDLPKILNVDTSYSFTISRLDVLHNIDVIPGKTPRKLSEVKIKDEGLAARTLLGRQ
ncbi:MAG: PDZ domain-containing protein [Bacteriovoracaceae bacterium]|nr:PDZ domain-containing protein [Bacteriovoracaceae bacterium]